MEQIYTPETVETCPMTEIQPVIQGKWNMLTLYYISQGSLRFGELSRKLPMVSQANLTKTLRLLEQHGLVHREVFQVIPPRVEYSLTELGRDFLPVFDALEQFGLRYRAARQKDKKE